DATVAGLMHRDVEGFAPECGLRCNVRRFEAELEDSHAYPVPARRPRRTRYSRGMGVLREVVEADLQVFYEYERDPEASAMAAFPSRNRDAFMAHWARTLANDSALTWTIICDGAVAGNIGCWEADGRRLVGYWIGQEFWGRGLATEALAELVDIVDARPLQAEVVTTNVASTACSRSAGSPRSTRTWVRTGSRSSSSS